MSLNDGMPTRIGAATVADSSARPSGHVPGESGVWVLLFGDMLVFAVLFTVYLNRRAAAPSVFAESQAALSRVHGVVNTVVLLTSSLLVVLAVRTARDGRFGKLAQRLVAAGFLLGCCFIAVKVHEYRDLAAAGIGPSTNEFFTYYFVLTGLHLLHVAVGLAVLLAVWRLVRAQFAFAFVEGGACFWHMVDLLWLLIFPLLFLVK